MSAIGKIWLKKVQVWISEGMNKEEALSRVPERWRQEVREALEEQ